jgi:hypothetical protein
MDGVRCGAAEPCPELRGCGGVGRERDGIPDVQSGQKLDHGVEVGAGHDHFDMPLVRAVAGDLIGNACSEFVVCDNAISGNHGSAGTEGTQMLERQGRQRGAGPGRAESWLGDTYDLVQTHGPKGNATRCCKATLTLRRSAGRAGQGAARACKKSAQRSSTCSHPTLKRMSVGGIRS